MSVGPGPAGGFDLYAAQSAALGTELRCPHCNGVASVDRDAELGSVCKLCGAPRLVLPQGVEPSDALVRAEKKADTARRSRALWRGTAAAGGVGLGATAILVLLVGLVAGFGWAFAIGALFGVPAALMLFGGVARSGTKTKEIARELEAALFAAALDLARAGKASTPAEIEQALGVDRSKAEELHAMVAVESLTNIDALDPPAVASRVRVGPARSNEPLATSPTRLPPDPRFDALEKKLGSTLLEQGSSPDAARAESEADAEREADAREGHAKVRLP